jgi:hypothetical protein
MFRQLYSRQSLQFQIQLPLSGMLSQLKRIAQQQRNLWQPKEEEASDSLR